MDPDDQELPEKGTFAKILEAEQQARKLLDEMMTSEELLKEIQQLRSIHPTG